MRKIWREDWSPRARKWFKTVVGLLFLLLWVVLAWFRYQQGNSILEAVAITTILTILCGMVVVGSLAFFFGGPADAIIGRIPCSK